MWASVLVKADPVADGACCALRAVEAPAMDALFLQRSDSALDHAVLLGAMRRDELLAQSIAADQGCVFPAGKNQPVVQPQ